MMSNSIYSLPIFPLLETAGAWQAFLGDEADPVISFKLGPMRQTIEADGIRHQREPDRVKEASTLRDHFFAIKDAKDALQFFQEYGPYQLAKQWDPTAPPISLSQILRRRDYYLDALLHRSIENMHRTYSGDELREGLDNIFMWQNLPLELVFRQPLQAIVRCKDVEDSLRATVFLDRLRALPWQRCIRTDCGKPFEVKGQRAKLYCSPECAHLQSVRNYNKRQHTKKMTKAAKPAGQKKGKG
jgi:hypothetical protein